jgi:hypothetical protein
LILKGAGELIPTRSKLEAASAILADESVLGDYVVPLRFSKGTRDKSEKKI